jgi:hypothetical protein
MKMFELAPLGRDGTPIMQRIGSTVHKVLTYDWIFSEKIEKIVLSIFFLIGFYTVLKILFEFIVKLI